jgi:hypothetical protein
LTSGEAEALKQLPSNVSIKQEVDDDDRSSGRRMSHFFSQW